MSRPPLGSTIDLFGLSISWYSLLMMTAVALGIWLSTREEKRLGLPEDTILTFSLYAIPLGIIGARLYYVAFTFSRFQNDLLSIFSVWNGGLAFYGAVLGGLLAAYIAAKRGAYPLTKLMDAVAPSLAIAQAIGRFGNYANMEAYGARIYNAAAQFFPIAVEIRVVAANGTEYWYWHMATFFYEFVWDMAVFGILMNRRKKMVRTGDVAWWYLLLYGAGRTVIEGLRDDSLMLNVAAAQVRVSQALSAIVCVAVVCLFITRIAQVRRVRGVDMLSIGIAALGIICTFAGEFERNAYQMLFVFAQIVLALMLLLDVLLTIHYFRHAKKRGAVKGFMLFSIALCVITLLLGIGRMGAGNTVYIALRQSVAMAHVALSGAWLYLRGMPRKQKARPITAEEEA